MKRICVKKGAFGGLCHGHADTFSWQLVRDILGYNEKFAFALLCHALLNVWNPKWISCMTYVYEYTRMRAQICECWPRMCYDPWHVAEIISTHNAKIVSLRFYTCLFYHNFFIFIFCYRWLLEIRFLRPRPLINNNDNKSNDEKCNNECKDTYAAIANQNKQTMTEHKKNAKKYS